MLILPVLDLKDGVVVRGVAGRRAEYRPVVTRLTSETSVLAIAQALAHNFGFGDMYVADLDAIAGQPANILTYRQLQELGLHLWIDAGIGTKTAADLFREQVSTAAANMIVGLESLQSPAELTSIATTHPTNTTVFSLDLYQGRPITSIAPWRELPGKEIIAHVVEAGLQRVIVLDLADVGVDGGTGTLELIEALRNSHPQLEITAGGGVRNIDDLQRLADAGCSAALVASALHDGRLLPGDIARFISD